MTLDRRFLGHGFPLCRVISFWQLLQFPLVLFIFIYNNFYIYLFSVCGAPMPRHTWSSEDNLPVSVLSFATWVPGIVARQWRWGGEGKMEMLYSLSHPTSPYIALKILKLPLFQEWYLLLNCKFKSTETKLQIVDYFILEKNSSKLEERLIHIYVHLSRFINNQKIRKHVVTFHKY